MSALVYPVALAAAASFAIAIPLEHRAADSVPDGDGGLRPRQIGAIVRETVRNRWWLTGMGLHTLGLGVHALALSLGGLAVVQPLLVANLLFALPINRRLRREQLKPVELGWAAVLVASLAGFLVLATAGVSSGTQAADRGPAVAAGALTSVVAVLLVLAAHRAGRSAAATLLGVATGVLFAVTASLLKECTGLLVQGPVRLIAGWQFYALLVVGLTGLLLNQLAYQAGPLSASLPAITVVNPLVSILLGVLVFDENLRHTAPAILGEVVFLGMLALAAVNLSRLEQLTAAASGHRLNR
ncbi:MAG TPA: DMT family transporter [Blastococcus sp.]|nr:DMT family transporter [Blastococcus sp.]